MISIAPLSSLLRCSFATLSTRGFFSRAAIECGGYASELAALRNVFGLLAEATKWLKPEIALEKVPFTQGTCQARSSSKTSS